MRGGLQISLLLYATERARARLDRPGATPGSGNPVKRPGKAKILRPGRDAPLKSINHRGKSRPGALDLVSPDAPKHENRCMSNLDVDQLIARGDRNQRHMFSVELRNSLCDFRTRSGARPPAPPSSPRQVVARPAGDAAGDRQAAEGADVPPDTTGCREGRVAGRARISLCWLVDL